MLQVAMSGTRLAYVVRQLEGTVERQITPFDSKKREIVPKMKKQDAGYIVYFPRGHVLRFKNMNELKKYKLHLRPRMINLQGLEDPNSAIGKLISAQDQGERDLAFEQLEAQVIAMATAKSGRVILPEQVSPTPKAADAA
jgi:hypothetical protein